jgi:hypothetical protein
MVKSRKKTKRKALGRASGRAHGRSAVEFMPPFSKIGSPAVSRLPILDEIDTLLVPELEEFLRQLHYGKDQIHEKVARLYKKEPGGLTELHDAGVDERKIIVHLSTIWSACQPSAYSPPSIPGMSLEGLRRLPALLLRIAGQLNAINEHRLMPSLAHYSRRKALPITLRLFARDLKERLTNSRKRTPGKVEPGTNEKLALIWYVRETTKDKGPHYKAVAAVINAFNELKNEKSGGASKKVTADSLKQLYLANPHLLPAL